MAFRKGSPKWTSQVIAREVIEKYKELEGKLPPSWHANVKRRKWSGDIMTDESFKPVSEDAWYQCNRDLNGSFNIALYRHYYLLKNARGTPKKNKKSSKKSKKKNKKKSKEKGKKKSKKKPSSVKASKNPNNRSSLT
ncbi:MAG: hypothetical protein ACTSVY_08715 [Candidatus Helarchaeota archaeon]